MICPSVRGLNIFRFFFLIKNTSASELVPSRSCVVAGTLYNIFSPRPSVRLPRRLRVVLGGRGDEVGQGRGRSHSDTRRLRPGDVLRPLGQDALHETRLGHKVRDMLTSRLVYCKRDFYNMIFLCTPALTNELLFPCAKWYWPISIGNRTCCMYYRLDAFG